MTKAMVLFLRFILLLGVSFYSNAGSYHLIFNDALQLCQDFLKVVNEHGVGFYNDKVGIDSSHDFVRNLKVFPADKEDYYNQIISWRQSVLEQSSVRKDMRKKRLDDYKAAYFTDIINIYETFLVDANHDGKKERFYLEENRTVPGRVFYLYSEIRDGRLYTEEDRISFSGIPFLYQGRFFVLSGSDGGYVVSETSVPYRKDSGFIEYDVCQYRVK